MIAIIKLFEIKQRLYDVHEHIAVTENIHDHFVTRKMHLSQHATLKLKVK